MPENQASEEYYADYNGLRYYFCCESCVQDFESDPSRFAALDSVKGFPLDGQLEPGGDDVFDTGDPLPYYNPQRSPIQRIADAWLGFARWKSRTLHLESPGMRWRVRVAMLALFFPAAVAIWRRYRRGASTSFDSESRDRSLATSSTEAGLENRATVHLKGLMPVIWIVVVGLLFDTCYSTWSAINLDKQRERADEQLAKVESELKGFEDAEIENNVHYATFINCGFPPRPRLAHQPNALSGVYYRGNDERFEEMFNGGQYLTVTFWIQLETEAGRQVEYGDAIAGEPLYLKVKFKRANSTSSGYFTSEYMKKMYLSMKADRFLGRDEPVADRIDWIETEPGQVWEARYKLPAGDKFPDEWKELDKKPFAGEGYRGVVYLCEERADGKKILGGRYHFAVEYDVRLQDGKVMEDSNIFMGSTYRGRNFAKYRITDEEWLSTKPIPEKPIGE